MIGKDARPGEEHIRRTRELCDTLLPALRECAPRKGYALATHGSLERDIDIVAVPWAPEFATCAAADLAASLFAVCEAVLGRCTWAGGWTADATCDPPSGSLPNPELKPHGRLAWVIHVVATYIDLSVMPRTPPAPKRKKP